MKTSRYFILGILFLLFGTARNVLAETDNTEGAEETTVTTEEITRNRTKDRLGIYASLWGDPYPALIGVNLAYNVYDFARLNLGVGAETEDRFQVSTVGTGIKFLVPGLPLSPAASLNVSVTDGGGGPRSIRGFAPGGARLYGTLGLDWQTSIGLNLAAGWVQSFRGGEDGSLFVNAGVFL